MSTLIWILTITFFGAIFWDLIQEARKPPPAPPPPPKEPEPPVFNFHTQVNVREEHHTHNTMHVTVVKAVPREEDPGRADRL